MFSKKIKKLGILGAGAFGTALAISYSRKFDVSLFTCFDDHVNAMKKTRKNEFLSDFFIPENVTIDNISNLKAYDPDYILWSFPVKPSISILEPIKSFIKAPVIICSKGLLENGGFLVDTFKETLPDSVIGYMSGPTFAIDMASYKISCADIGAEKMIDAETFAADLSNDYFKLYATDDIVGMQIAGAVKNIMAIACGIASGLNLGQDTHASLLTLGLWEMKNLGVKLGGAEKTFYGFCGVGDLVLTASSETSRNMSFGTRIAEGESAESILKSTTAVCEGCQTVSQIVKLARRTGVKMPICESVYKIIYEQADINSIIDVFK